MPRRGFHSSPPIDPLGGGGTVGERRFALAGVGGGGRERLPQLGPSAGRGGSCEGRVILVHGGGVHPRREKSPRLRN